MTGQELRERRKKSGLTAKRFYEEKLGYENYSSAIAYENFAVIPEGVEKRLKDAGLKMKKEGEK